MKIWIDVFSSSFLSTQDWTFHPGLRKLFSVVDNAKFFEFWTRPGYYYILHIMYPYFSGVCDHDCYCIPGQEKKPAEPQDFGDGLCNSGRVCERQEALPIRRWIIVPRHQPSPAGAVHAVR